MPMSARCTVGAASLYGEAALALKHGRLALAIEKGRVVKVDRD